MEQIQWVEWPTTIRFYWYLLSLTWRSIMEWLQQIEWVPVYYLLLVCIIIVQSHFTFRLNIEKIGWVILVQVDFVIDYLFLPDQIWNGFYIWSEYMISAIIFLINCSITFYFQNTHSVSDFSKSTSIFYHWIFIIYYLKSWSIPGS